MGKVEQSVAGKWSVAFLPTNLVAVNPIHRLLPPRTTQRSTLFGIARPSSAYAPLDCEWGDLLGGRGEWLTEWLEHRDDSNIRWVVESAYGEDDFDLVIRVRVGWSHRMGKARSFIHAWKGVGNGSTSKKRDRTTQEPQD